MKLSSQRILTLPSIFMIIIQAGFSVEEGQIPCHDDNDCPQNPNSLCRDHICICEKAPCDVPKIPGEKCIQDIDCFSNELVCLGKGELRSCRCKKMHSWDLKYNRCIKDETWYPTYDPVSNLIIPAIIVMSVGAMVYLGIKLFCNCGKLWRRRRSQLTRELEGIASSPHQQTTWVASYRVFSPLNNPNQAPLHPTSCMGLFVPGLSSSPPPYDEALNHKVIMSSYHPSSADPAQLPVYSFEPPVPLEPVTSHIQAPLAIPSNNERDQRHLRYFSGGANVPTQGVWSSGRSSEVEEMGRSDVLRDSQRVPTATVFREGRSGRSMRFGRQYSVEPSIRAPPDSGK